MEGGEKGLVRSDFFLTPSSVTSCLFLPNSDGVVVLQEVGGGTTYNPTRPEPTTSLHAAPSASQPTPAPLSDDLRSSSIAVLRQKAQEHAARMSLNNNMAGLHHPEPLHHHHLGHF